MPEQNFIPEKIVPGQEIETLKERVEKIGEGAVKESAPEKKEQMVKQEIKDYLKELQRMPATAAPLSTRDEADEINKFPADQQVGALVSLVFEKSLSKAIQVAKKLGNPAILDEFHDILADRYYKILIEKKIIKP